MDIRLYTGIIIERDGEYLVGVIYGTLKLRWSASPWDAWITRERANAMKVARAVGGKPFLFNPISSQIKEMEVGNNEKLCVKNRSQLPDREDRIP